MLKCLICGVENCMEHCRCFSQMVVGHHEWCPVHDVESAAETNMPIRAEDAKAMGVR